MVKLDKCVGSSNTLNDLSNKECVLKKIKDLIMFLKMITDKNESKILTKDIYANVNVNLIGNVI